MSEKSSIIIFLDDETEPIGEFLSPVNFELNTNKMVDGKHTLKIVSKDPGGKEGIRLISFIVKNGPTISVEGLKDNTVVDGVLPIMINAYGKGNQKKFLITGSETPQSIPSWVWILIISFFGWALYYLVSYLNLKA